MILDQQSTLPNRVPLVRSDLPTIGWVEAGYLSESNVDSLASQWARIPSSIRSSFNAFTPNTLTQLHSYFGTKPVLSRYIRGVMGPSMSGIYANSRICGTSTGVFTHEYGHHVDACYQQLWPSGNGSTSWLTTVSNSPFAALYDTLHPYQYPNYSGTNHQEWFAEAWANQISEFGTASAWVNRICAGSQQWATEARMLFTGIFPGLLPSFAGGQFDALPANSAPVAASTAPSVYLAGGTIPYTPGSPSDYDSWFTVNNPPEIRFWHSDGAIFPTGYPWPSFQWEYQWRTGLGSTDFSPWVNVGAATGEGASDIVYSPGSAGPTLHFKPGSTWPTFTGQAVFHGKSQANFRLKAMNSYGTAYSHIASVYLV